MDQWYMELALKEAQKAFDKQEVPIGAIIVRDQQVVGVGHNLRETRKDATAHAEMVAIENACRNLGGWRLTNSTLYVTIEPCPMCAGAILQSRIDRIVIGAMDPKAGACGSIVNLLQDQRFNHQTDITVGVLEESCSDLMKRFFRELRNRK